MRFCPVQLRRTAFPPRATWWLSACDSVAACANGPGNHAVPKPTDASLTGCLRQPRAPARVLWLAVPALSCAVASGAPLHPFQLPTANQTLFERGGEERFFVGTVGKPWTSGTFGCTRSDGGQMHEGLDIRCLHRDERGEPLDPVLAAADGTVAYANRRPTRSNYGNYLILRHEIEGLEIYSVYAHLREIRTELKAGQSVRAGQVIGILGRTANTREGISKDRAHVHFELNLLVNDRFPEWYEKTFPRQRNDHGVWNGHNLLALDPRAILIAEHSQGRRFSLLQLVRGQTALCRVQVRAKHLPWARRYRALVRANPKAEQEDVAGYELALSFNGVPFEVVPRAASELRGAAKIQLLSVDAAEQQRAPCGKLVTRRRGRWELTTRGLNLLDLLTY
jgi:murein DD-endopeptidase MepM/ murein hydrolase activator NlpD